MFPTLAPLRMIAKFRILKSISHILMNLVGYCTHSNTSQTLDWKPRPRSRIEIHESRPTTMWSRSSIPNSLPA